MYAYQNPAGRLMGSFSNDAEVTRYKKKYSAPLPPPPPTPRPAGEGTDSSPGDKRATKPNFNSTNHSTKANTNPSVDELLNAPVRESGEEARALAVEGDALEGAHLVGAIKEAIRPVAIDPEQHLLLPHLLLLLRLLLRRPGLLLRHRTW
ncbi:hypothetical protein ACMD2_18399 [Ananas comosus]|uniref:Uncharacterized protein n=1 Tax=Ananas comosus TaxID=4615 RepID=A0A199W354_ANACO|nr:hypothetical protein ACMD2_18399 [Ananas comosus]